MDSLSTVLAVLFVVACGGLAYVCIVHANLARAEATKSERAVIKVQGLTGRVVALEGALESLAAQHRRVAGKFHAFKAEWDAQIETARLNAPGDAITGDPSPEHPPGGVCENYLTAQREGPHSEAARCGCSYCEFKRAERDQLRERARALPSHAATVRAIEAASRGQ